MWKEYPQQYSLCSSCHFFIIRGSTGKYRQLNAQQLDVHLSCFFVWDESIYIEQNWEGKLDLFEKPSNDSLDLDLAFLYGKQLLFYFQYQQCEWIILSII